MNAVNSFFGTEQKYLFYSRHRVVHRLPRPLKSNLNETSNRKIPTSHNKVGTIVVTKKTVNIAVKSHER